MAGVHLGESTVESTTEDVGALVADLLSSGHTFGHQKDWSWNTDAQGQRVAYVSLDATGVRQQFGQGQAAEGRMAYVGMVYNPELESDPWSGESQPGSPMQARYISGLYSLTELGELLRLQARQVGMERADRWIGISDGGNGLESCLEKHFPRVERVILDYWHAAEYLWDLAGVVHRTDPENRDCLAKQWCRLLKEEGGALMVGVLEAWEPAEGRQDIKEKREEVIGYFRNQAHRMEYPEYLQRGWQIGSGPVESSCKTVVGARLKGAGMRWGEAGTHNVCQLRALYRSEKGQWNDFWNKRWKKTKQMFYHQK